MHVSCDQVEEQREWAAGADGRRARAAQGMDEGEEEDGERDHVDKSVIYKQILDLLQPGETVLKVMNSTSVCGWGEGVGGCVSLTCTIYKP